MGSAKIKTSAIILVPIPAAQAPANSIFSNSGDSNAFTNKTFSSESIPVGAVSSADAFAKRARNMTGEELPANVPVSRASDGSVVRADSDAAQGQRPIGVTLEVIADGDYGLVGLVGRNLAGALAGFEFTPGQDLYVSEDGNGYTADPDSFTGGDDSLILIGIADCASDEMGTDAPDLILLRQILVRP